MIADNVCRLRAAHPYDCSGIFDTAPMEAPGEGVNSSYYRFQWFNSSQCSL